MSYEVTCLWKLDNYQGTIPPCIFSKWLSKSWTDKRAPIGKTKSWPKYDPLLQVKKRRIAVLFVFLLHQETKFVNPVCIITWEFKYNYLQSSSPTSTLLKWFWRKVIMKSSLLPLKVTGQFSFQWSNRFLPRCKTFAHYHIRTQL